MAGALVVQIDDAGRHERRRLGARIVGRNRAQVAQHDHVQVQIRAAPFVQTAVMDVTNISPQI